MSEPNQRWCTALGHLPIVRSGRWAVGGSAALALHGLPVDPRDLDLVADRAAASELIAGLGDALMSDEEAWDRGDVRAARRAVAIVEDLEVEILVEVEAMAAGLCVLGPPDLDNVGGCRRWRPMVSRAPTSGDARSPRCDGGQASCRDGPASFGRSLIRPHWAYPVAS